MRKIISIKNLTGAGNLEGRVRTFSVGWAGIKSGFNAKMASSSILNWQVHKTWINTKNIQIL